ncbi:MAG: hypothetical protein OEY94_01735 [Alphaproteobacteria bacterium]|nr:hypothetical protein [Alphaproteobacteria bacterium]
MPDVDGKTASIGQSQLVNLKDKFAINPGKRMPLFDNGSSLAYEARDSRGEIQIAIICDPKMIARFTQLVAYGSLIDTSLFHLTDHGIVFWPPDEAERYVLIYSCACNQAICHDNGGISSRVQWRTSDIMSVFIKPMIKVMEEMHSHNFVHGSIRPSNIYFSTIRPKDPIVLGDCLSVQTGSTQPAIYEPIDRAMAHPLARGPGTARHDVYSFGVTLVMLLRGKEYFVGLSDEEIVRQKIEKGSYVTLVGHERFHSSFLTLLRGVLHDDETQRWDIEEINSWFDGGRLSPPQTRSRKKASRPFHFMGKTYYHRVLLAFDLHKSPEELYDVVKDETLGQWLGKALGDKYVYERYVQAISKAEKNGSGDKEFLVTAVRMALAPDFPVMYKGVSFCPEGIGALGASYIYQGKDVKKIKEILTKNIALDALKLDTTSTALPAVVMQQVKLLEVARLEASHERLGSGVVRCIYALCKDSICLSPKFKRNIVQSKKDIMRCFEEHSKNGEAIALYVDNHVSCFLFSVDSWAIDRAIYDIASDNKDEQIFGNLLCLANLQESTGKFYPEIAKVLLGSMDGVYSRFHNKNLREKIKKTVEKAAKEGDLYAMFTAFDNPNVNAKDKKAFRIVCGEYAALEKEKKILIKRMSNKKFFGLKKGRDMSAVLAWIIATVITCLFVIGFIGGKALL